MTKIDIFSGFLGAGKTTLIKKLIAEAYSGEKLVLIENEFGEINIDGGFLKESGIEISEMSAGCICCSLVGDFNKALKEVVAQFHPDRILIEPSGVGKLSDVIVAVERTVDECLGELKLNSYVTVADASKVKVYMKNFGEFYNNQIEAAGTIILSRTQKLSQEKLEAAAAMLREKNPDAAILTTPWDELDGKTILSAIEKVSLSDELLEKMRREHEIEEAEHEHEHHHHHDHDEHDEHDYEHEHHHDPMRMSMTMSMGIITTMTMTSTTSTSITTITTTVRSATIPSASATITIITTPTTSSPPGARRRRRSSARKLLRTCSTSWTAATTATSCVPRAS